MGVSGVDVLVVRPFSDDDVTDGSAVVAVDGR